jgi:hypothetical protein
MNADIIGNRAMRIENFHPRIDEVLNLAISNPQLFRPAIVEKDGIFPSPVLDKKQYSADSFCNKALKDLMQPMIDQLMARKTEMTAHFSMKRLYLRSPHIFMTRMGDGDFLSRHSDMMKTAGPNFELTFLIYLHSKPKRFSGGELELYWDNGMEVIAPLHNMLVAFPGALEHAVRVVTCPSNEFRDSRFVVVGRFCAPLTFRQLSSKAIRASLRRLRQLWKRRS